MKKSFLYYYHYVAAALFLLMGLFVLIMPAPNALLEGYRKPLFGILLVIYGLFRIYKGWKFNKFLKEHEATEEED